MMERAHKSVLEDRRLSWVLMIPIIVLTAQYLILLTNDIVGIFNISIIQYTSKAVVAVMYLIALPVVLKRRAFVFFGMYIIAIVIFLSHFIIFPENHPYLTGIVFPFFFMCLPAFIYSLSIKDWSVFNGIIRRAAIIVFLFGLAISALVFMGQASIGDYSMALSYYLLLPALIYFSELLDKPSIWPATAFCLTLLIILALGSRGAIMCIVIFLLLKLLRPAAKMTYMRLFVYLLLVSIGILMAANLNKLFQIIYEAFIGFGIKSRTLELLLIDIGHLSGRDDIYEKTVDGIMNHPILGIGIGGDRRVSGGEGFYAHNFFLEVFANFGVFFGGVLLSFFLFMIVKIILTKSIEKYQIAVIWLCLGFIPLMVSGSYLIDINFWVFAGLLTNYFTRTDSISMENQ